MVWKNVRCFEVKRFADLHRGLERAGRTHRFEPLLDDRTEKRAGDSGAVDHAVIEREANVHHRADRDRIADDDDRAFDDRLHRDDRRLSAVDDRLAERIEPFAPVLFTVNVPPPRSSAPSLPVRAFSMSFPAATASRRSKASASRIDRNDELDSIPIAIADVVLFFST
jgi:hypothetical protein